MWLAGEGPCGLIICPSRELARQTYEVILGYTSQLAADGYPQLHTLLCMGGVDMKEQTDKFKHAGLTIYALLLQLSKLQFDTKSGCVHQHERVFVANAASEC